jgi:hypothetical protein
MVNGETASTISYEGRRTKICNDDNNGNDA